MSQPLQDTIQELMRQLASKDAQIESLMGIISQMNHLAIRTTMAHFQELRHCREQEFSYATEPLFAPPRQSAQHEPSV